jgi:hypothetical protein
MRTKGRAANLKNDKEHPLCVAQTALLKNAEDNPLYVRDSPICFANKL